MSDDIDMISLTVDVVSAFVGKNNIRPEDVPAFIATTHAAIAALGSPQEEVPAETSEPQHVPAVSARKSLASRDHIISMIDGKPYRTLRRHLSTHGLTPEDYRARYKLPTTYPMVAETYSEARREMAKRIGLGRKVVSKPVPEPAIEATPEPVKKTRAPRAKKVKADTADTAAE